MTKETAMPAYLIPGLYPALRITTCKVVVPKDDPHWLYIVEMEIVKSEVVDREVGTKLVWLAREYSGLQAFLAAVLEKDFCEVTRDDLNFVFMGEDPLRGHLLRCEAHNTSTRNGRHFTHCQWSPIKLAVVSSPIVNVS